ncbi:MAG TPA: hypothetical protein VFM05_12215 [Candidatus Saccharimonadales bacterium]|nr:hypothetical protein [Candidatus Saccharimonadales bacterium]
MKLFRRFWPYFLLAVLIACNVTVWMQRERIADWWRLRNYQAPTEIAALVSDTQLTAEGQRLFYINHPSLEGKDAFNKHCSDYGEETAVLGCYHGNRRGIYLYAVTDPRLEGVRQVTAAHEMLHQAYDRLDGEEKKRIGRLLQRFYEAQLSDQTVRAKLENYNESDADLVNEMHSIFGTEVRALSPELEVYYKRYFKDRLKVVGYGEAYQGEFTRRKELVKQYNAQLEELKGQFLTNKAALNGKLDQLKSMEKEIDQALATGDRPLYEAAVDSYNELVDAYNSQLSTTRRIIDTYNRTLEARKEVTLQEHELYQALDSHLGPEQQQQ